MGFVNFPWKIVSYAAILSLSGSLHGFNTANISGVLALETFRERTGLDDMSETDLADLKGWITASLLLGAGIGALISASITSKLGCNKALALWSVVFIIGAIFEVVTPSGSAGIALFIAGRVVNGLGGGAASVVGTRYIAEIAPKKIRGGLSALYNANTMLGVSLAYWINYGAIEHIDGDSDAQWQVPLAMQILPGAILIAGLLLIPESPRWLVSHDRVEEARASLSNLRSRPTEDEEIVSELGEIVATVPAGGNTGFSWTAFKTNLNSNLWKRLILVANMQFFFQFSGGNIITYYNDTVLKAVGLESNSTSFLFSGIYGLTKVIAVLIYCGYLVDRLGRRSMLFAGTVIILVALMYMTIYLGMKTDTTSSAAGWAAVVAIYVFALGYAISWAPAPWIINSEVFPIQVRSLCMSLCITWQYLVNFGLTRAMPNMTESMHTWGPFALFTCVTTVGLVYCYFAFPETKGMSLEDIDSLFNVPWYQVGPASVARAKPVDIEGDLTGPKAMPVEDDEEEKSNASVRIEKT